MAAASHVTSLLINNPLPSLDHPDTHLLPLNHLPLSNFFSPTLLSLYFESHLFCWKTHLLLLGRSKSFTTSKLCINSYMILSNDSKHGLLKPISTVLVKVLIDLARLYYCPSG